MGEMLRGVVKWFNDAKGFGFIEHSSGRDVFVHYSVIESDGFKTLKDGEQVDYELREGDKGLNASRVMRTNAPTKDKPAAATSTSAIEVEKINAGMPQGTVPISTSGTIGDSSDDSTDAESGVSD